MLPSVCSQTYLAAGAHNMMRSSTGHAKPPAQLLVQAHTCSPLFIRPARCAGQRKRGVELLTVPALTQPGCRTAYSGSRLQEHRESAASFCLVKGMGTRIASEAGLFGMTGLLTARDYEPWTSHTLEEAKCLSDALGFEEPGECTFPQRAWYGQCNFDQPVRLTMPTLN